MGALGGVREYEIALFPKGSTGPHFGSEPRHLELVEGLRFIHENGITYQSIWFDDPKSDHNYDLEFDEKGRPLNPNPFVEDIGIAGHGFYFRLGQNMAGDNLLPFENEGRIYIVLNERQELGSPLAFPAGE